MVAPITKELSTKLLRTVPLLKKLAANPNASIHSVADSLGITHPTLYNTIIPEFLNIYDAASKQPDFPSNLLTYYNQHGNPEPAYNLTEAEAHGLKPVFQREYTRKPEQFTQAYYSNPHPFGQMGGQQAFVPTEQTTRNPNLSTNALLISYIMEKVRLAPIGQIQKFVQLFEMKEDYYMTHPEQLKELFKSQFGPLPGEIGFNHFMLTQPDYVYGGQRQNNGGYPFITGIPTGTTTGMGIPGIPGMMPGVMGANPVFNDMLAREQYEDMRDDRKARHQANQMAMATQAAMASMMQRSVEAKQPLGAEVLMMGDIEEEFDSQGNLVGRKIIRKAGGGMGGDNSAAMFMKEVVEMYKLQYQNEREEKKSILERSNQPNETLSKVFNTIVENQLKMNPFEFVKGLREMGTDFFGSGRTRETIDADRDWDLTILKEKQSMMAMEHDWNIQEKANAESKEHMTGFIGGLSTLVKDVVGPKINKFLDGAMSQMSPGGPGAGHGQRGPAQPQGSPSQQINLPRLAPGLRWVQTPQGLAIAREMTPQQAAAMGQGGPAGTMGGMPSGMAAAPDSFEQSEDLRIQKQANELNNFAHQLAHGEKRLQEWDQQLGQRERNAVQAEQYAQSKLAQANELMRAAQISQETRSFEEFTQDQLKKYYENTSKQMDEIKKAITEKAKQEREAAAEEISQDDTTPVAATETAVYEGEYEDPHAVPDDSSAAPSNASRDDVQDQGTPSG